MRNFKKVSFEQYKSSIKGDADLLQEYNDIKLPRRATTKSAGFDFYAPFAFTLQPNEEIKIPTGIRCFMEDTNVLLMFPRSGHGFKFFVRLANTVGVVDADYTGSDNEGHIFVKIRNEGKKVLEVKQGEAFCQGIILNFLVTDDDCPIEQKRNGGFGSTN